jgi:hypothetical protein
MLAEEILPSLLEAISPNETPSKLLVATLRTLNQITDATAQEKPWTDSSDSPLRSAFVYTHIYINPVIESFAEILAQTSPSTVVHQQISWTAKLIIKSCQEDDQRKMLLDAGILDLLATKLAAIAAVDEQSRRIEQRSSVRDELPLMYLSDILEAISTIIRDSHFNTARFLYSQPIQQLFGWPKSGSIGQPYEGYSTSSQTTSWDKLIPRLQTLQSKSDSYTKSWPALGSYTTGAGGDSYTRLPSVENLQPNSSRAIITDESENPLFIWLMFVARRGEGRERLSACWLLALLKKFGEKWAMNDPSKTTRERYFSYLIIPLVVKMIQEANTTFEQAKKNTSLNPQQNEENKFVLERSPLVLAELVTNNKALQNAAVDAKILPVLVQILKKSFDPVIALSKPLWQPKPASPQARDPMVDPVSSTLGRSGLSPEVLHALKYRESALLALAAMGDSQDGLRKLIIEIGAATHIIDSLVPYTNESSDPSISTQAASRSSAVKEGNPVPVLIAASKVTRSLSRSISVLRTSLIDHGIAQPSFDLLTHPNVKVQIAATEVITNLVLEVSPMRTVSFFGFILGTYHASRRTSVRFPLPGEKTYVIKRVDYGLVEALFPVVNCIPDSICISFNCARPWGSFVQDVGRS